MSSHCHSRIAPRLPIVRFRICLASVALAALAWHSAQAVEIAVYTHPAMGTEFEVRIALPPEDAAVVAQEVFQLIDLTEGEISSWRETSYTTYVNHHAAREAVRVSPGVLELFVTAKRLSESTFGAFDPTVGPLIDVWKIRSGGEAPADAAVAEALSRVGMRHVQIDESASTIRYGREGLWVDWGAIGKGYALDLAAKSLRGRGVESALLSAGTSTIVAIGAPLGEPGWKVTPPDAAAHESALMTVLLRDASLSTSACFQSDRNPCDILDPRVGRPVARASSATVIAGSGADADALSTALLVMTREEAATFFAAHPEHRAVRFETEAGAPELYNWNP